MKTTYKYAILKLTDSWMQREAVIESNYYSPDKKYALIEVQCYDNGTEKYSNIFYSNDLSKHIEQLHTYCSYYDYITGEKKNIQGYKSELQ